MLRDEITRERIENGEGQNCNNSKFKETKRNNNNNDNRQRILQQ